MRVYRTEITRAEFDTACRLYTTRPTTGTGSSGGTGSTGGTGNTRNSGTKSITTPIRDGGFIDDTPIRVLR